MAGIGWPRIAVFAVVVVLDDPGVVRLGEAQQAEAHVDRHDQGRAATGRTVSRRSAAAAAGRPSSSRQPSGPTRSGTGRPPAARKRCTRRGNRFLEPEMVARIHEQPADQVQRGLGAGDDDHLLGIAGDAARDGEMLGHRRPQPRMPAELVIAEQIAARVAHGRRQKPRPGGEGKARDLR